MDDRLSRRVRLQDGFVAVLFLSASVFLMRRLVELFYHSHGQVTVAPEPDALREAKRRWAELLRSILEVEPLACPRCGEARRIVAFVTQPKQIDRILDHLRRTRATRQRPRAPPRRWKSAAGSTSA